MPPFPFLKRALPLLLSLGVLLGCSSALAADEDALLRIIPTLSAARTAQSYSVPVPPDTGVNFCIDGSNTVDPCPSVGETGYGQDGNYTTLRQHSYTPHDHDDHDTVSDNVTGLMWMQREESATYPWKVAFTYCRDLDWGGHTDWRLPSLHELAFLTDRSQNNPAIDPLFTCLWGQYWTSTPAAFDSTQAWMVDFGYGVTGVTGKTVSYHVRCVRDEQ